MDISMNLESLISNNLSVNEYLYLYYLFLDDPDQMKDLYKLITEINEDILQDKGFIKITEDEIILRQKTLDMFSPPELFYKFLSTFPIKTPSGRYLSPAGTTGIAVTNLKKKWKSTFKNKQNLEQKAIRVLEAELKWRKQSNNLEYIHNAETWLNQADFEKYEYLIEEEEKERSKDKWM